MLRYRVSPVGPPLVKLEDHYNRRPVDGYLGIAHVFNVAGSKVFCVPISIMNRQEAPVRNPGGREGIWECVLEDVPVLVGEKDEFGDSNSAVLGAHIFEAYRVTIDYSVFKVYLEKI